MYVLPLYEIRITFIDVMMKNFELVHSIIKLFSYIYSKSIGT